MYLIGGIDEVGRGALAGPIMAAVAVMSYDQYLNGCPLEGVKDSKKFSSEEEREQVYDQIMRADWLLDFGVGAVSAKDIDEKGINWANQEAFRRALGLLHPDFQPHNLVVDGTLMVPGWGRPQVCVPKADRDYWQVSVASIIAKVIRDRVMGELHLRWPQYHWLNNKGYGSKSHITALHTHGPCRLHRERFIGKITSKNTLGGWSG